MNPDSDPDLNPDADPDHAIFVRDLKTSTKLIFFLLFFLITF